MGWEVTLREHSAMYVFHIAAIVHAMSGACLTLFTPLPVLIQPMFLDGCWQWGVDKKGGAVSSEGHERRRGTCAQEPEREEEEADDWRRKEEKKEFAGDRVHVLPCSFFL